VCGRREGMVTLCEIEECFRVWLSVGVGGRCVRVLVKLSLGQAAGLALTD
jgi:hypothetical protein